MKKILLILILLLPLNLLSFDSYTQFGDYEVVRIDYLKHIDDEEGRLWFSSWGAIFGVNIDEFSDVFILDTEEYWSNDFAHYIVEWAKDSKDNFYMGYSNKGLMTYNEESGYTLYTSDNSDLLENRIRDIFLDKDNYLWIKTFHAYYQRFKDGKFETFKSYEDFPSNHPGFYSGQSVNYKDEFYTFTLDSNLISWDGDKWTDHNLISPEGNDYGLFNIRVYDNKIWSGTDDVVISYDGSNFDSISVNEYFDEDLDVLVTDIAVDERNGDIWALISLDSLRQKVGGWELHKFYLLKLVDKKMEKMIFLSDPELIDNEEYNYFLSMVIDKSGKLYLATNRSGLVVYDPSLSSVDIQVFVDKTLILGKIKPNPLKFESELDFFCRPEHVSGIRFTLYDYMGREVRQYVGSHEYSPATARGTLRMDKAGLKNGLYFLNVRAGGESETRPVIIE